MKSLYDVVSYECSKLVTNRYSTSFSLGTRLLNSSIRTDIYNIYGFVRFADEIVDSFHEFNKEKLLNRFEEDLMHAIKYKISLNPILNSFQFTVNDKNPMFALDDEEFDYYQEDTETEEESADDVNEEEDEEDEEEEEEEEESKKKNKKEDLSEKLADDISEEEWMELARKQEKELRGLIQYTYGMNVYNEMIELRRKLRKQREDEIYRKREFKRQVIEFFAVLLLIVIIVGFIGGIGYLYFNR